VRAEPAAVELANVAYASHVERMVSSHEMVYSWGDVVLSVQYFLNGCRIDCCTVQRVIKSNKSRFASLMKRLLGIRNIPRHFQDVQISKHKLKRGCRFSSHFRNQRIPLLPNLPIPLDGLPIQPLQIPSQRQCQQSHQHHRRSTYRHASRIERGVAVGIQSSAHQRPALPDQLQHGKPRSLLALRLLVIHCPRDDDGDDAEEAHGRGVDAGVAPPHAPAAGAGDSDEGVAERGQQGVEHDEGGAVAQAVREVGGQDDDEEGE